MFAVRDRRNQRSPKKYLCLLICTEFIVNVEYLDLNALLAPLETSDGAGEDLRADYSAASVYQRLRDARSDARAEERARDAGDVSEPLVADGWRVVRRLTTEALATRSKDFEIAAWLTEALVRQNGLAGLAIGADLLAGLLDRFWDTGFPQPDEDGFEGRAAPLGGLAGAEADGTIMQALRRITLFRRPGGEALSLYQYEAALETATIVDEARREQRLLHGFLPLDTIEVEARFGRAALSELITDARLARGAWQRFQDQLDIRFGSDAPASRRVAEILERLAEVPLRLGGETGTADAITAEASVAAEDAASAPKSDARSAATSAVTGREDALRQLEHIATFFQRTEPHSFLAYTLSDAVRRGRLSLPELLNEVLPDESSRSAMLTALGIRPEALA